MEALALGVAGHALGGCREQDKAPPPISLHPQGCGEGRGPEAQAASGLCLLSWAETGDLSELQEEPQWGQGPVPSRVCLHVCVHERACVGAGLPLSSSLHTAISFRRSAWTWFPWSSDKNRDSNRRLGSRRGRVGPGAFPALGIQGRAWARGFFSSFLQGYFKTYGILSQALLPLPGGATRDASSRTWREDSSLCMCWNRDPGSGTCRRGLSRALASRGSGTEVWLGFQTAFSLTPKFCLLDWPGIPPLEFYSFGYSRKMSVHLLELAGESLTSGSEGVS